ncbi:glycine betaine/L-proline ABC transporter ATP-binding protein [Streptomyces sp. PSKA54]|uniref:Glycine betaine/L-proline ABC transporter ATP-binding protein n=1 Tax=Streptomyces himalayensis subsp. aureolus TaxID=2758039 RepID=A0A7W2D0P9_9ACTN|nr:glycine betaine/L-proline ABC transporter ATP-binding protein [Streptomyces himalayensis]MBA4862554.1 glycine betaine/L-proline ABC transporter ATP-binding protein [Streptomyces himalayensis subsp. aureolus]
MSRLQAEHLYKVFGRRPEAAVERLRQGADRDELRADGTTAAVIDASFTVEPGQIFVVMGLSGSGKSTLLRMLNGLLEPTAGQVRFDGQDLTALSARELREVRSRKISMVFQHFALFPHRSVLDNAAYGLEVQGVPRAEREKRATEALELAGLKGWEQSWPDQLSGGMQQRVGLARALATDADLLLMDESFSALDPLIRRDMQDQLLELQKRLKKTIVFITHDLNEAMRLGDRIAVMRDGRIVQIGTAEDILVTPANDYVAAFTQDVDRSRVLTAGAIMADPETAYGTKTPEGRELRTAQDVLDAAPATVSADTPIIELFTPCSTSGVAVAVTDADGQLVGVVPRARLLAVLGEPMTPADQQQDAAGVPAPAQAAPAQAADDAANSGDEAEGKVIAGA